MKKLKLIPHNQPSLGSEEVEAVSQVLQSKWLVAGKRVSDLENSLARAVGVSYAVATNSGVAALHLGLLALGVSEGDEVILPTYTCTALLNAVYYVGATPVLVDSESDGVNADPKEVKNKITAKTKAMIIPHTFAIPAKIDEMVKPGVALVEDCAVGWGSSYHGKPLGSFGTLAIFSFYASKVIAAGQGGMVITSNKNHYESIRDLTNYDRRSDYKVRYNYQSTDISAAIALVQIKKAPLLLKRRQEIAGQYRVALQDKKKIKYWPERAEGSNHYRFILRFNSPKERGRVKKLFMQNNISTIVPIENYQLLHRYLGLNPADFPVAEQLSQTTLSIPVYPGLTDEEVGRVVGVLRKL